MRRDARDALQDRQVELTPDGRRHGQHIVAARREMVHATHDGLPDRLGEVEVAGGCLVLALEASLGCQQPDDLPYEEGVALGLAVHGREDGLGGPGAGDDFHEAGHLVLAEAGEGDGRGRLPTQGGQRLLQRVGGRQLDAVRPDDEQAAALQRAGEELRQQQGRGVGRLQVVEDDDQRTGGGRVAEQRRDRIEEPEPCLPGVVDRGRGGPPEPARELGEDLRDVGGPGSHQRRELRRVPPSHVRPQHLDPRPVGGRPLAFVAAPDQHLGTARACIGGEFVGGARLADARLAAQQHHPSPPRCGFLEQVAERLDLPLPPDEHARAGGLCEDLLDTGQGFAALPAGQRCPPGVERQRGPDHGAGSSGGDEEVAPEGADAVVHAGEAVTVGVGPALEADAVVRDRDGEALLLDGEGDGNLGGLRMLEHVGNRLREDEVGAGLDIPGEAGEGMGVGRDPGGDRDPARLGPKHRGEPEVSEDRGVEVVADLADTVEDALDLRSQLGERGPARRGVPAHPLRGHAEGDLEHDELLLEPVVEVTGEAAALLVPGRGDAQRRLLEGVGLASDDLELGAHLQLHGLEGGGELANLIVGSVDKLGVEVAGGHLPSRRRQHPQRPRHHPHRHPGQGNGGADQEQAGDEQVGGGDLPGARPPGQPAGEEGGHDAANNQGHDQR